MRAVKALHKAEYEPIAGLVTYRAIPTRSVPMNLLDPFIFLNHHGWQKFPPENEGLPFGPHPHRGFETVTFILEGDLTHKDSSGAESVIKAGGIQWMTAGSGLIHAEVSSKEFKTYGGPLELLQLWVNLPAKHKMTQPKYTGLQKEAIPTTSWDGGKVSAQIVSGNWNGVEGAVEPVTDIHLASIDFKQGGKLSISIPASQNIFFYVVKGELNVNSVIASKHHLVEFDRSGDEVQIEALTDAFILIGYATPFNEPFIAHGPFVMNTVEEIKQAYEDYKRGKFGKPPVV